MDALVSVQLNLTSADDLNQPLNFTWSLTHHEISIVKEEINPTSELIYFLAEIESKLSLIRLNLSLDEENPLNIITSYKLIFDLAEQFCVETKFIWIDTKLYGSRWYSLLSFIEIQSAPYAMFIKGMNRRFIELSYGTIFHIGYDIYCFIVQSLRIFEFSISI